MYKKILLALTAAALALSATACAANRGLVDVSTTEPSEDKPVGSEQLPTQSESESQPSEPEAPLDYDAQLALLAANYEQWVNRDEYNPCSYTVTDLDCNGRLEVLVSACLGTGQFSYNDVWEVNEAFDGVTQCTTTVDEAMQPDLTFTKQTTAYYNATTGCYAYIFSDAMRNGVEESVLTTMAVTLTGGVLSAVPLATMRETYSLDADESTVSYYANDVSLTEEEFLSAADTAFADCEKYRLSFDWATYTPEENAAMDETAWLSALQALWQSFSLEKE